MKMKGRDEGAPIPLNERETAAKFFTVENLAGTLPRRLDEVDAAFRRVAGDHGAEGIDIGDEHAYWRAEAAKPGFHADDWNRRILPLLTLGDPDAEVVVAYLDNCGLPRAYAWGPVRRVLGIYEEAKRQFDAYRAGKPDPSCVSELEPFELVMLSGSDDVAAARGDLTGDPPTAGKSAHAAAEDVQEGDK
jgi:hypothetical protein